MSIESIQSNSGLERKREDILNARLKAERRRLIPEIKKKLKEENEPPIFDPEFEKMRSIIKENWWKHMSPFPGEKEGHPFKFDYAIRDVAKALGVEERVIRQCILEAVTPSCLVKVRLNQEKKSVPLVGSLGKSKYEMHYLLEVLQEFGSEINVWTLGDKKWQEEKLRRSGALEFLGNNPNRLHILEGSKIPELEKILNRLLFERSIRPIHVYVVDDSYENIKAVKDLYENYRKRGIELHDYQLKLDDPQADGTAFYAWIEKERSRNPDLVLVLDFDQVIADTNAALLDSGCENIFQYKLDREAGLLEPGSSESHLPIAA